MFEWIASPEAWVALGTLVALEVVLGIDNIIFISILVARLPAHQRDKARQIGLGLAMGARLLLLFALAWIMGLVEPLFTVLGQAISGRDIILIVGGLFLLAKATHEIHASLEGQEHNAASAGSAATVLRTIWRRCGRASALRYPRLRLIHQLTPAITSEISSPGRIPAMNSDPTDTLRSCSA